MSGAAGSGQAAVDMGGLVDAIHVASTGVLGMRGIATRNAGPSALVRLTREARYRVDAFGVWPSITVDPGAKVRGSANLQDAAFCVLRCMIG